MGDNNPDFRAEAIRLITERMPQRMAWMGNEASWAVGLRKLPRGHTPPLWVRRLICDLFDVPHARARPLKKITSVEVADLMGCLFGLVTGARVLFEHPIDTSEVRDDLKPVMVDFQKRMGDVARPQLELAGGALAQVSTKLYRNTPETETAFHAAQSNTINEVFSHKEEPVTDEVCFFLWCFWPEAKTATSVRELHEWLERLKIIHCGTKNFEKICRRIGFRGSARGRKKNTLNSYSADLRSR
jgi:hypothetical protein